MLLECCICIVLYARYNICTVRIDNQEDKNMEEEKTIALRLNDYGQKGLYLILKDSSRLELTRKNIKKVTEEFWNNPDKIPSNVKEAIEFQRCSFCPLKRKEDFCDALRPVLPFLDIVDKYVSFDKVTAIFKGKTKDLFHVSDTAMQDALQYVSILGLMHYCQIGKKYWKYYFGIIPLMRGKEVASRLYLNIYWLHKAKKEEIDKIVSKFIEEIRLTSQNQVKRLSLICKNDVFMNAFVTTQVATEFLSMDIEKRLEASFDNFERELC